ncbi:MAG: hypothetical protein ABIK65_08855 [Candidatus Eisenbacteria bacterium]
MIRPQIRSALWIGCLFVLLVACGDNGGTRTPFVDDGDDGGTTGNTAPVDTSGGGGNGGDPGVAEQSCEKNATIRTGEYGLLNNKHGEHRLVEGDVYEQCIRREAGGFPVSWRWKLDTDEPYVKGFPQIYYGRHLWTEATAADLFPARIDRIDSLVVRHDVLLKVEGTFNLAFDLWVTADDTPAPEERTHEIMIWLDGNIPVDGDRIEEVVIGGDPYDFYRWEHRSGHMFLMFVARDPRPSGTTDLGGFLRYLRGNGDLSADGYLAVIELGTEMWDGNGSITVNDFEVSMTTG